MSANELAPLTLSNRECAQLMGVSMSQFYKLKAAGLFQGLQAPLPERWSRAKVELWLKGEQPKLPRRRIA